MENESEAIIRLQTREADLWTRLNLSKKYAGMVAELIEINLELEQLSNQ